LSPLLSEYTGGSLNAIKEKVDNSIGYGEIKLAIGGHEFQ